MEYNTSQQPEILGREARNICGRSVGDPFCAINQSIGADHLLHLQAVFRVTKKMPMWK